MKIALCGPGECGKDDGALFLARVSSLRFASINTSWFARHIVCAALERAPYFLTYADADACWEDRRNNRKAWFDIMDAAAAFDPVGFYLPCIADQDILVGMRKHRDYTALKRAGVVDHWIYIDRPGKSESLDSLEITPADCDRTIMNDGSLAEYHDKLAALAAEWRILRQDAAVLHREVLHAEPSFEDASRDARCS